MYKNIYRISVTPLPWTTIPKSKLVHQCHSSIARDFCCCYCFALILCVFLKRKSSQYYSHLYPNTNACVNGILISNAFPIYLPRSLLLKLWSNKGPRYPVTLTFLGLTMAFYFHYSFLSHPLVSKITALYPVSLPLYLKFMSQLFVS